MSLGPPCIPNNDFIGMRLDTENAVHLGKVKTHDPGHSLNIDAQWIHRVIGVAYFPGPPFAQGLARQCPAAIFKIAQAKADQR